MLRFIEYAAQEAKYSEQNMRHGCVAVINGKIIGRGHNCCRVNSSDGFLQCNCCSCHAEISAIRNVYHKMGFTGNYIHHLKGSWKFRKIFRKISLYVVRVNSQNKLGYSAPCHNCLKIIKELEIKKVIFTTENQNVEIIDPKVFKNNHITLGYRLLRVIIKK